MVASAKIEEPLPPPKRYKVSAKWLIGLSALTLLVPVFMIFVVFPWLAEPAFQSVSEIDTNEIDVLRVQLLNNPKGGPDVGPVEMNSADFTKLFAAFGTMERVDAIPAATWLGEYRVRFRDNRRGTIRLYWQRENPSMPNSAPIVWMRIGKNNFRAGNANDLIAVAEECATRAHR